MVGMIVLQLFETILICKNYLQAVSHGLVQHWLHTNKGYSAGGDAGNVLRGLHSRG
jgi:hypothetical protein